MTVRITLLQLSKARKNSQNFINLYHEIIDTANGYPDVLRQNALWLLPENNESKGILSGIIQNEENAVSFNAMKYLYTFAENEALSLADQIIEESDLIAPKALSAAVHTKLRSYSKLSETDKSALLQKCKYIINNTSNADLSDMTAISLAECKDINAVKTVVESNKVDELYKQYSIIQNEKLIADNIKAGDQKTIKLLRNNPGYANLSADIKLAVNNSSNIQLRMTIPADPVVGYQAYTVYCDGKWYNLDWHAGIMNRSDSTKIDSVIHVANSLGPVETASWSEFLGGTAYKGLYKAKSSFTVAKRTNILTTARKLTLQDIGYTMYKQVEFKTTSYIDTTKKETVDDIVNIRCDGVIEYSYEYNGVRVFGDNDHWDVSNISQSNNEAHKGTLVTPKKQAEDNMTKVSSSRP